MGASNKQTESNDDEESLNEESSCLSPLHAIPGFDRVSKKRSCPKGIVLLVEGQAARGAYVLCSGRAKVSIMSAEGKTSIVRIARPGDLLGIQATLAERPYEATVETISPCRVDFISRKDLFALLDRQKTHTLGLAIAISKEYTALIEHARVLLLSISANEKLAHLLLRFGDEFGQRTTKGIHLKTLLTHEEIAQVIGTSRETVTRSLNLLKRRQVIRTSNGDLMIRNRDALMAIAQRNE